MAEISVIQGLNWAACLVNIHAEDATRGAATIVTERLEDIKTALAVPQIIITSITVN
jgi:hypothetical protein